MPAGQRDPGKPGQLLIDGHYLPFTEEVIQVLLAH
jgi:hypothetical protein